MSVSALLVFLSYCLVNLGAADEIRILTIKDMRSYEDKTRSLEFDAISSEPDKYLSFAHEFVPADYRPEAAYWVELDFCIEDSRNKYIMEFYDQTIDTISVYLKHSSDTVFHTYEFGDQYNFEQREFNHKNFQVVLDDPGAYHGYVRVVNREYADIRIAIRSLGQFISYALLEYYLYGIFYGMILIISLYNILIYSAIREIKYVYYTMYILSVGFFAMSVDGIAYQLLWPGSPNWNTVAHGVFLFSIIIWSIVFSKRFLGLPARAPRINKALNIILLIRTAIFIYALFVDHSFFSYRFIEIVPLSLIFISSFYVFRTGYKPARFFIVAYGFLFSGFIIKALLMYSIIPFRLSDYSQNVQIITYYSLHICFLLEMLFLSIALSDRVRIIKENRDRALRKIVAQQEENNKMAEQINSQLEENIAERTQELRIKNVQLEEANNLLSVQKQEISAINSLLDLDNWKLRNNLKSAQANRILKKTISYRDFEQIFPEPDNAIRFMAEHKWKSGYSCKRCSNEKYIEDEENYSRRCTRCGYNETPTTDTVFHAIKFPLNKALYILYVTLTGDERTLSQLSNDMDLRKNTIWSMRKKIREYMENYPSDNLDFFDELEIEEVRR